MSTSPAATVCGDWRTAVTGRLLAEQITTGKQPEALRDFDPLRRTGH